MIDHQREMLERVLRSLSQRLPNNRDFLKPLQNSTYRPRIGHAQLTCSLCLDDPLTL
jgi:hypothetical protein